MASLAGYDERKLRWLTLGVDKCDQRNQTMMYPNNGEER